MTKEQEESLKKIKRQISIGECEKILEYLFLYQI